MTHFRLDVTITSITSITSGFCTDVTLDVHFQGATLMHGCLTACRLPLPATRGGLHAEGHCQAGCHLARRPLQLPASSALRSRHQMTCGT